MVILIPYKSGCRLIYTEKETKLLNSFLMELGYE